MVTQRKQGQETEHLLGDTILQLTEDINVNVNHPLKTLLPELKKLEIFPKEREINFNTD